MSSVAEQALDAVKARLAVPNGSSPYTYDLTATGTVRIGVPDPAQGGPVPAVYLWAGPLAIRYSEEMGSWHQELTLYVHARVPSSTSDPEDRVKAGIRILDDLLLTLRADRDLGSGIVLDSPPTDVNSWDLSGVFGMDGLSGCKLTIKPWWIALSSEGA